MKEGQSFKPSDEYDSEKAYLEQRHSRWRQWTTDNKVRFFPVFSEAFRPKLQTISGSALKLYLFLGGYADPETGLVRISMVRLEKFFGKDRRSIYNWMTELQNHGLIRRVQPGKQRTSFTYLLPYHSRFDELDPISSEQLTD